MSEPVTKAEFSRISGLDKAYVSRAAADGRLVMEDGKVRVDESLARLHATRGTRDDVAERHAEKRQQRRRQPAAQSVMGDQLEKASAALRMAKARDQIAQAAIREMERDQMAGRLIARDDAGRAMRDVGAAVRAALENFPDQVAPLVAMVSDLEEIHRILAEQCRNVMSQTAELLRKYEDADA